MRYTDCMYQHMHASAFVDLCAFGPLSESKRSYNKTPVS